MHLHYCLNVLDQTCVINPESAVVKMLKFFSILHGDAISKEAFWKSLCLILLLFMYEKTIDFIAVKVSAVIWWGFW